MGKASFEEKLTMLGEGKKGLMQTERLSESKSEIEW